jgi:hypothetical protein
MVIWDKPSFLTIVDSEINQIFLLSGMGWLRESPVDVVDTDSERVILSAGQLSANRIELAILSIIDSIHVRSQNQFLILAWFGPRIT